MKHAIQFLFLFLCFHHNVDAEPACHPECRWQCDDPVCPAACEVTCTDACSTGPCDDQECTCESFTEPVVGECTPPLSQQCTICNIEQTGRRCEKPNGERCTCELDCEQQCFWECQTPNCRKPTCELQCEQPACSVEVVFPRQ